MGEVLIVRRPTAGGLPTAPSGVFINATGGTIAEYFDYDLINNFVRKYRSHTFTSNGNFVINTVGETNLDRNKVDYLIVAGGGGGAGSDGSGGGGGGYRTTFGIQGGHGTLNPKVTVTQTTYGVTIGGGGFGSFTGNAGNGAVSSVAFSQTITSSGGGGGARGGNSSAGTGGGSGGGGGRRNANTTGDGGTGIVNQGYAATGSLATSTVVNPGASGGAGAGGNGFHRVLQGSVAGSGGPGLPSTIRTGVVEYRAGGGGGSSNTSGASNRGVGGIGGGGTGIVPGSVGGADGTVNTGGGGGGGRNAANEGGGAGGSGIVIIRYEIAPN